MDSRNALMSLCTNLQDAGWVHSVSLHKEGRNATIWTSWVFSLGYLVICFSRMKMKSWPWLDVPKLVSIWNIPSLRGWAPEAGRERYSFMRSNTSLSSKRSVWKVKYIKPPLSRNLPIRLNLSLGRLEEPWDYFLDSPLSWLWMWSWQLSISCPYERREKKGRTLY